MTNKKYKLFVLITIIMLLGLIIGIALIFTQSFSVQKSQLDQRIQASMVEVSDLLAQNEKIKILKNDEIFNLDSLFKKHKSDSTHIILKQGVGLDTTFFSKENVESRIEIRMESQTTNLLKLDSSEVRYQIESAQFGQAEEFAELIRRALGESKSASGKKFNESNIRLLMKESLSNNGVKESFKFGIYDLLKDSLVCGTVKTVDYKTALFPMDVVEPNRYELRLDPKNISRQILLRMGWSIVLLVLFTLAIISCFTYAIHVINKQKKIDVVKSDFINNMTHEFKTPLASISLAADTIVHENVINNKAKTEEMVQLIKEEKSKMMHHVERVLEMARLDSDALDLNYTQFDVLPIIHEVLNELSPLINEVEGNYKVNGVGPLSINGDAYHIKNVLNNVLENAIKYRASNLHIEITAKIDKNQLYISILDNGIGISKDNLNQVFDKFFREESGNIHNVKGFGLGLSYVKRIIELHNGEVNISSNQRKGTLVEIKLPVA